MSCCFFDFSRFSIPHTHPSLSPPLSFYALTEKAKEKEKARESDQGKCVCVRERMYDNERAASCWWFMEKQNMNYKVHPSPQAMPVTLSSSTHFYFTFSLPSFLIFHSHFLGEKIVIFKKILVINFALLSICLSYICPARVNWIFHFLLSM